MFEKQVMLTTLDNPWSPFDNFEEWWTFDKTAGYHTIEYLARVCVTSDNMSEVQQDEAYMAAINSILEVNVTGNYILIREGDVPMGRETSKKD